MIGLLLVATTLAQATPADAVSTPTQAETRAEPVGFVRGFHGLAALSAVTWPSALSDGYSPELGTDLIVRPRFGFDVRGVALTAGAELGAGLVLLHPDSATSGRFSRSDLELNLAAPGLLRNADAHLLFTPALLTSVPLRAPDAFSPVSFLGAQVRGEYVSDRFRLGLIADGARYFWFSSDNGQRSVDEDGNMIFICRTTDESCGLRSVHATARASLEALAEMRIAGGFSLGADAGLSWSFRDAPASDAWTSSKTTVAQTNVTNGLFARLFAIWRFHPLAGVTLSAAQAGIIPDRSTLVSLSVFGRTDEVLEPEWLAP